MTVTKMFMGKNAKSRATKCKEEKKAAGFDTFMTKERSGKGGTGSIISGYQVGWSRK